MSAQIVIPSEVEGSRYETFKVTQRDPSVRAGLAQFARDDGRKISITKEKQPT